MAILPPVAAWHGASESRVAPPGSKWETPSERTGLTDSPGYDETLAWLRRLSAASSRIRIHTIGTTAQGRELVAVLATQEGARTPGAVHANGRPTLLAQGGIHSGEIDGKDAGMMLLRDLAFGPGKALLARANFVLVPVFNADGHERVSEWNRPNQRGPLHQGWRTTAQNLNLNRDYMKADAPEMRAMLGLLRALEPDLYLDLHVTDGADYQYDITFGYNGEEGSPGWSPRTAGWLDQEYRPFVSEALRREGHVPGPLIFTASDRDLSQGLIQFPASPRFSHGYGDARHLPTLLVENHSLKTYRQRVLGTHVLLEASLKLLGTRSKGLREAVAADRRARPMVLPSNWVEDGDRKGVWKSFKGIENRPYRSIASGQEESRWTGRPVEYAELPVRLAKPALMLRRPRAFWVPVTKPEVIARLREHGIVMEIQRQSRTIELEMCRLEEPKPSAEPFEGRHLVQARISRESRIETFPAGSVRVSTDQPLGDLAVLMLDPAAEDSLCAWGFFPEILQKTEYIEGYAVAPLADRMLRSDPGLAAQFEKKVAGDRVFAADGAARLEWFYARSRFFDGRWRLYPVGIERE